MRAALHCYYCSRFFSPSPFFRFDEDVGTAAIGNARALFSGDIVRVIVGNGRSGSIFVRLAWPVIRIHYSTSVREKVFVFNALLGKKINE